MIRSLAVCIVSLAWTASALATYHEDFCRAPVFEVVVPTEDAGYMNQEPSRLELVGKRLTAVEYAERFEAIRAGNGRRIVGVGLYRLDGAGESLFAGTVKVHGTPFTWDQSWKHVSELPGDLEWFKEMPWLTTEPLYSMEIGEPLKGGETVFWMIQTGPLRGLDLVYVGCSAD